MYMSDYPDESWGEIAERLENEKNKVGRPATGQNTKVMRVPKNMDRSKAIKLYYDWLPIIEEYRSLFADSPHSVRNEKLGKLLQELGEL
jgi:hypothetical protein